MSFKVGDWVVVIDGDYKKHYAGVYPVLSMRGDYLITLLFGETAVHRVCFRHATPEEIAAGHRIEQGRNTSELEVLEMIDVSPNCEVGEI